MKRFPILVFLSWSILVAFQCHSRPQSIDTAAAWQERNIDRIMQFRDIPTDVIFVFKRTGCYGKCPEFNAVLWNDGRLFYKGIKNIEPLGTFYSQVLSVKIDSLFKKADRYEFWSMAAKYPTEPVHVSDSPKTITFLQQNKKRKQVENNNFRPPKNLTRLEQYIENIIFKSDFTPTNFK